MADDFLVHQPVGLALGDPGQGRRVLHGLETAGGPVAVDLPEHLLGVRVPGAGGHGDDVRGGGVGRGCGEQAAGEDHGRRRGGCRERRDGTLEGALPGADSEVARRHVASFRLRARRDPAAGCGGAVHAAGTARVGRRRLVPLMPRERHVRRGPGNGGKTRGPRYPGGACSGATRHMLRNRYVTAPVAAAWLLGVRRESIRTSRPVRGWTNSTERAISCRGLSGSSTSKSSRGSG